jgi:hypothetical protein
VSAAASSHLVTAALLAGLAVGCLPEAGPPAGTRLVEERHVTGVRFLAGGASEVPRLLFGRRVGFRDWGGGVRSVSDLWAIDPQGASSRLIGGVDSEADASIDALGRLWAVHLRQLDSTGGQSGELVRVDATGLPVSVGVVDSFEMSPGRTRILAYDRISDRGRLRELDGHETMVNADPYLTNARFVGETLAFPKDLDLWMVPPGQQQPALLASDVDLWRENPGSTDLQITGQGR